MFKQLILEKFLKEERGKTLVVVDIQPEYEDSFDFELYEFLNWVNQKYDEFDEVVILFNGPDLGFLDKNELISYYIDNGLEENYAFQSTYFDKGYAFFRNCMDEGVDEEEIVKVVKYMYQNGINDSRDIDEEMWNVIVDELGTEEAKEYLLDNEDMINIPDLMDFLKDYDNIILTGGHHEQCLKEVEIALDALEKNYVQYSKYVY